MPKAQPTHFVSGLQGGYVPNVVEHYDTKTQALDVLAEWAEEVRDNYWDQPEEGPVGDVRRDGLIQYRQEMDEGVYYDYALVEPCIDPGTCEADNLEGWE